MKDALVWTLILFVSFAAVGGLAASGLRHAEGRGFDSGYSAGWRERQREADAENNTMRNIGLCGYAKLVCKVAK